MLEIQVALTGSLTERRGLSELQVFLVVTFFTLCVTPYLLRNASRVLMLLLLFSLIASFVFTVSLSWKRVNRHQEAQFVLLVVLWAAYEFLLRLVGYSSAELGNYLMLWLYYCCILVMVMLDRATDRQKAQIGIICFFVILINIVDNLYLGIMYPGAQTLVNLSWGEQFLTTNVGGTSFYATAMFYCASCFLILLNSKRTLFRILASVAIIISICFLLFISPRATAVILSVVMIFLILLLWISKHSPVIGFILILGSFLMLFFLIPILEFLVAHIIDPRLSERFASIVGLLRGQDNGGNDSLTTRLMYSLLSLKSWTADFWSFVVGVGNKMDVNVETTGIGQHSQIIDSIAKYGIIGQLFMVPMYWKTFLIVKGHFYNRSYYYEAIIIVLMFFLYSLMNNSFKPEIGAVLFIFFPLIPSLVGC